MSRFHVDPNERVDIFEFDPEELISATPPNVITIRARMNVEIAGRVSSELMHLGADNKPELHVGAHVGALLAHNILAWRGPDFDDLPCTPANIRMLPSPESDPFIAKVADEIAQRNREEGIPKPKIGYGQHIREKWRSRLEAERKGRANGRQSPVGDWQTEVGLAMRFGWTPAQVGALDPDYLEELLARLRAESDLDKKS